MINKNCYTCECAISVKPDRLKDKNFCSKKCAGRDRDKRIPIACLQCGAVVLKHASHVNTYGYNLFCSRKCQTGYQVGSNNPKWVAKDVPCAYCNKVIPHHIGIKSKRKFCDKWCFAALYTGKNHYAWNGGPIKYPKEFNNSLKKEILKRDHYKCVYCKCDPYGGKGLHVHHIDCNEKNNSKENLVTLCSLCHKKAHIFISKYRQNTPTKRGLSGYNS